MPIEDLEVLIPEPIPGAKPWAGQAKTVWQLTAGKLNEVIAALNGLGAGPAAREIELRMTGLALEWRYIGDANWDTLISREELRGAKGDAANFVDASAVTLDYGEEPTVTLGGSPGAQTIVFGIPEGAPGSGEGGTGQNGKSAYEIAVQQGFVGTANQWLASLVGASATITSVTVTALAADATPSVVLGGTASARTMEFRLPLGGGGFTGNADAIPDGTSKVLMTPAERTKLGGVATGATANASNAQLRDRTTHTGVQPISTVDGLGDALDNRIDAVPGSIGRIDLREIYTTPPTSGMLHMDVIYVRKAATI